MKSEKVYIILDYNYTICKIRQELKAEIADIRRRSPKDKNLGIKIYEAILIDEI